MWMTRSATRVAGVLVGAAIVVGLGGQAASAAPVVVTRKHLAPGVTYRQISDSSYGCTS